MKIAFGDNQQLKFDQELKVHWENKGYEVRYEMGASEHLFQWCDLYYINYWDNNIHYLYKWHQDHLEVKKPKIVCRAVDWEVWSGLARDQAVVDWVDVALALSPLISHKLEREADFKGKLSLIRPGVDLEKWTLKNESQSHNIIMFVNEIDWYLKHTLEGLKIFKELLEYDDKYCLTVKGRWCQTEYFQDLIRHYVKIAEIEDKVVFDDSWAEDLNSYLENFNFLLLPSLKEAFSFTTAQCAAKGIKPVLNWWMGAEEIYPKEWLYKTAGEAVNMIWETKTFDFNDYRRVIEDRYDIKRMLSEYDALLGI